MSTGFGPDERDAIAGRCLEMDAASVSAHRKELTDVDATYYWQPIRGGFGLIVGADGTALLATSLATFDQHVDAYRSGRRTDPSDLEPGR